MKTVLVTGGAGFIGSCYVLSRRTAGERVVNLDKLTYSGNIGNLASLDGDAEHIFVRGDIGDALLVRQLLHHYQPDAVINFAAESHVDRSSEPAPSCAAYWNGGKSCPKKGGTLSVSCTFPRMRYTERSAPASPPSRRPPRMRRTAPIRHPRRPAIIS